MKTAEELFNKHSFRDEDYNDLVNKNDFLQAIKEYDADIIELIDDMINIAKDSIKDGNYDSGSPAYSYQAGWGDSLKELKNKL